MIDFQGLRPFANVRILVVGDVMLDRYYTGDTSRISPEAPVPIVMVSSVEERAGGAANVARNIAHLGAQVGLLGLIGQDAYAKSLAELLSGDRIQTHLVSQSQQPTITKTRVISRQQQLVRLDHEASFDTNSALIIEDHFKKLISDYDLVVFSDYNKGTLQFLPRMLSIAKEAAKTVLVDPKKPDFSFYRGADIITPNLSEFCNAGGSITSDTLTVSTARELLSAHGIGSMLLTRSERGMILITPGEHHTYPARVREVSDVTGAGDTVISTLAVMIGAGMPSQTASEAANVAAGIVVGKLGTATLSFTELLSAVNSGFQHLADLSSLSASQLIDQITTAQIRGERIVFTNGCFDILHAGHVRYLAKARTLGDRLVVGLNTDASVSRLKGAGRPINSFGDRAAVLSALQCVDWVLPFGDNPSDADTPLNLIKAIKPHVLVKGGDYKASEIVGSDFVSSQGGQVHVLEFIQGRSTSNIIEKIQTRH